MTRTAVAAPDAFEDLFEFIDTMTVVELVAFYVALRTSTFYLFGDRIDRDTGRTLPITYRWPGQP